MRGDTNKNQWKQSPWNGRCSIKLSYSQWDKRKCYTHQTEIVLYKSKKQSGNKDKFFKIKYRVVKIEVLKQKVR